MKTILIPALILTGTFAVAQHNNSISRSINDNGKTLSIRVNGTVDGTTVDYDHTFNVADLSKAERKALTDRVLDSLNVSMPEPPKAPKAPVAPKAPNAPRMHSESVSINSDVSTVVVTNGDNQAVAVGGKTPFTKVVNYNSDSGKMHLRYRFEKDGDDVTYDRTLDVKNKSKEERQRLIEEIEKTIGVPTK